MSARWLTALVCLAAVGAAAWLAGRDDKKPADAWTEVAPGVFRSSGLPAGYALLDGDAALLIDAPHPPDGLKAHGVKRIETVLLTRHHRGAVAALDRFLADQVPVRAPKASAEWLTPENVRKYWQESLPLRNSRTAYLIVPAGFDGITYDLADGQTTTWRGWRVQVVATPGHSRDHVSFAVRPASRGRKSPEDSPLIFCGGALAAPGKLWAPYTTDWDHWTDAGLTPTAQSLRKLAALKPSLLLPAYGPVIDKDAAAVLTQTAAAVEEVAFLKSFERYTKKRLGNAPDYRFLARGQAESNGSLPWTQLSDHLYLTGNTYVLTSKDNAFLVVDPWDKRSADQVLKLQKDRNLGRLEVVWFSHAHYDHYDGIYHLLDPGRPPQSQGRGRIEERSGHWIGSPPPSVLHGPETVAKATEVWTLDKVAPPIADPYLLRAPFLDPRPVKFDRLPKDGETLAWREYRFRFRHLPGQTEFTMGVETTLDGKRCFFTADNWFHQDQFSGTGGWMGLNRSFPLPYAESAKKVLDAAPDWVLAEHGGPFEFNAEDWRRRVEWGKECAKAADAICLGANHRLAWDPHRVHVEPLVQKAKPGGTLTATLVVSNPLMKRQHFTITLEGRGQFADQTWEVEAPAGAAVRRAFTLRLPEKLPAGRHVFALRAVADGAPDESDAFLAVDVGS